MLISPIKLEILKRFGSQENFAAAAGLDESLVSKIARGVRKLTASQAAMFEELLGMPVEQLFMMEGNAAR